MEGGGPCTEFQGVAIINFGDIVFIKLQRTVVVKTGISYLVSLSHDWLIQSAELLRVWLFIKINHYWHVSSNIWAMDDVWQIQLVFWRANIGCIHFSGSSEDKLRRQIRILTRLAVIYDISARPTKKADAFSIALYNLGHQLRITDCAHQIRFNHAHTTIFPEDWNSQIRTRQITF